ncbi:ABC transporter ATP-binding protein [Auraticoccus monumenti]|uniref:Iron complex transport system ATP-binding protein n=1 Tax=Auraticoccus monumenti TaxID=675864 RepID=A0A1G6Y6R7_9ACTN|nr:ABC transporter ATP-binding protein [Auraticoccus monumenti]SDD85286.1 iron complex transport system ATP-binding protein [Auraticoccus monumenti]
MLHASGIHLARGGRTVLHDVDLTARTGQVVGVIGPNGSGKTTLLRTLYDALTPQAGAVVVDGTPVRDLSRQEVARRVAVVAQEPESELPITVLETVMLGRLPHRPALARPRPGDHAAAHAALDHVRARHLAGRLVSRLSGGERQRVLVARAIAQDAGHLLLDEPTNHLDIRFQHEILQLVRGLAATTVVTLHDLNLAAHYCDAVLLLDAGRVVAAGPPAEVLAPAVLAPVYGVAVHRTELDGRLHLLFSPDPCPPAEPPTDPHPGPETDT